jgi:hypothetical protein
MIGAHKIEHGDFFATAIDGAAFLPVISSHRLTSRFFQIPRPWAVPKIKLNHATLRAFAEG